MRFRRFHVGLVIVVLIAACVHATAQSPAPPVPNEAVSSAGATTDGPIIAFDEKVYDFGKSWAGDPVSHIFVVSNIGNALLEITNVHPSCGCTTAGDYSHKIEPGKTGTISIRFDNSRYNGPVTKTIDVFSNAKNTGRAQLMLHGTVKKALELHPLQAVILVRDDSTDPASATVKIVNNTDTPVTISDPSAGNKKYTPTLKEIVPGREYELTVTVQPPYNTPNAPTTISLKTSMPGVPTLTLSGITSIQRAVQVSPAQLMIGPPVNRWTTNRVVIHSSSATPLVLTEPQSSDNRLHLSIVPVSAPNMFNLVVAIPPNYQLQASERVEATIKSNHPRYPLLTIPINQPMRYRGFLNPPPVARQIYTNGVPAPHP